MTPLSAALEQLAARWEADAGTLRARGAASQAELWTMAAKELRAALAAAEDERLGLAAAALESGVPVETLRKQIARGAIPNAGKRGRPLIRRADLPSRPRPAASCAYDPSRDALQLAGRTAQGKRC